MAAMLGIGDGVINTQLSALIGILFKHDTVTVNSIYLFISSFCCEFCSARVTASGLVKEFCLTFISVVYFAQNLVSLHFYYPFICSYNSTPVTSMMIQCRQHTCKRNLILHEINRASLKCNPL